ncbi:MAG: hypothetical protein HFE90_05020 [Firmicutes bacterium]|nr:hypothetical protein [Bacillota bacterium]
MSGLDRNRKRNQIVSFRMSLEERRELNARIAISGLPKGEFLIQSALHQKVNIVTGKYQSDRLSLEVRRLREILENINVDCEELYDVLADCKALMNQFVEIINDR